MMKQASTDKNNGDADDVSVLTDTEFLEALRRQGSDASA